MGMRERVCVLLAVGTCALAGALVAAETAAAAGGTPDEAGVLELAKGKGKGKKQKLTATIRRTKYGVPHIRANDIESLAAGYGYAFAEDDICTLANEYVTVAAKRSEYFGPDGEW